MYKFLEVEEESKCSKKMKNKVSENLKKLEVLIRETPRESLRILTVNQGHLKRLLMKEKVLLFKHPIHLITKEVWHLKMIQMTLIPGRIKYKIGDLWMS